ncbi:MAG TPA: LysM peptidoglycan-binding domain-containing protein [Longimicrobium sp.]|nr:LysM peptidoglycan-binding domain-containing protein [Longimicrobium sp.]
MRSIPLLLLALCCAAADAAAQTGPRRPPADTIRFGQPAGDSIQMAEVDGGEDEEVDAEADTVPAPPKPKPGPYARSGGAGPFSVQASGDAAPRPPRGEVVWVSTGPAPRAAARDSARRDTARAGGGQRVTSGQPARRDTASTSRPAPRDTVRPGTGQRVATGQPARRDTTSTRPAPRDTTARRTNGGRTGTSGTGTTGRTGTAATSTSARPRSHTVSAGETFYAVARRYGVTPAQLRALNPDVDMNALEVGDVLRLPAGARDRNAGAQPQSRPQQQGRAQQPARGSRTHTVAAGETLFGIARRYGVTVDAIRRANEMETDQVRAGQRLVIPPAS